MELQACRVNGAGKTLTAYVTTRTFLEVFGLASPRDLPDIESLDDAGLPRRPANEIDLDGALGIREDAAELVDEIDEA